MALSETFPPTKTVNKTGVSRSVPATRMRIPITARELVEWTYAGQRAHAVGEFYAYDQDRSQTGVVVDRLMRWSALGCEPDVSSGAIDIWGRINAHEDALLVDAIARNPDHLSSRQYRLLRDHGIDRSAPDWQPKIFPLRCVPVEGARGGPRGLYLGSGRKLVGHEISYEGDWPSREIADAHWSAINAHMRLWSDPDNWPGSYRRKSDRPMVVEHDWSPEPYRRCADEVLQRARDDYRAWYEALWALCDGLEAAGTRGLRKYRIGSLGAAYEPWRA